MEPKASTSSSTAAPADNPLANLQHQIAPHLEQAEDRLQEVNEKVQEFIRQNPGACMLGATAIGFLAGSWASRR